MSKPSRHRPCCFGEWQAGGSPIVLSPCELTVVKKPVMQNNGCTDPSIVGMEKVFLFLHYASNSVGLCWPVVCFLPEERVPDFLPLLGLRISRTGEW